MFIKPLYNPREFDVFLGEGWDNWLRVRLRNGRVEVINTNIEGEIEPRTLQLIFFKVRKMRAKNGR